MVPLPGPPPHETRYSVAGIVVVLGLFVLFGLIGGLVDDGADAESLRAGDAGEMPATGPPPTTDPPALEPASATAASLWEATSHPA